jgi:hypothetical protein
MQLKNITAGILFLGIAGFAGYSLASAQSWFAPVKATARLEASDDPVRNGLNILNHREAVRTEARDPKTGLPTVVQMDDWTYTGKPAVSPYF